MPLYLSRKKGSPNWYVRGTVGGITVEESTRIAGKKAAEAYLARRQWELEQQAVFGHTASKTFLDAAVSYMEAGGEIRFVDRLIDHFKAAPLKDIDQTAIDTAASTLYPGRQPSTINRQVHGPMAAILRHASENGWVNLKQVRRPRVRKTSFRWLTPDEAETLLAACAPHMRSLVLFLLYTGARTSEALLLEWRNVNLGREQVQFVDTKSATGGKSRGVPLHPRLLDEMRRVMDRTRDLAHNRVFLTQKGLPYKLDRDDRQGNPIKVAFNAAVRRAGIERCTPHDMRHTWATWHYAANRDIKTLMQLGGWDDEASVHRYTHVNVSHLAPSIANLPSGKYPGS